LRVCNAFLRRAFQAAQDAGDLSYAAYSCIDLITNRFATGNSLSEVEQEAEDGLEFAGKVGFGLASDCITGQLRLIRTLRGLTPDFNSFNDAEFDDFDILPHDVAEAIRDNDRQVIEAGVPIQFEETVPSDGGERVYVSAKFLRNRTGKPYAVCGVATDITELKKLGEMQAALARERELFAQQRATELGKANEALRGCLDALASVPELDDFLGQVMAAITRQLGAVASTLRVLNLKRK
jgi:hypothetical protein